MEPKFPKIILSLLGVLSGLALAEVSLRPWASAWRERPFIHAAEVRQYYEGIAVANYGADGERLTGNPEVAGAPNILILGDSHVEAMQVADAETMGSVLERRSRAVGEPRNVHQYGWSSGAAPLYALRAPTLLNRWKPGLAVVLLNPADLKYQAFAGPTRVQMTTDGRAELIDESATPAVARSQGYALGASVISHSVLAYHLYRAVRMMETTASQADVDTPEDLSPPPAVADAAFASVNILKAAYGTSLLIVYDPILYGVHTATADEGDLERALMRACQREGVSCVSTRMDLIHDRLTHARLSRGFSNTRQGVGHWNRNGHAILGEVIWRALKDRPQEAR